LYNSLIFKNSNLPFKKITLISCNWASKWEGWEMGGDGRWEGMGDGRGWEIGGDGMGGNERK
jgi:hypothetical protein